MSDIQVRDCGCCWRLTEPPRSGITFVERCDEHANARRDLEMWEIDLYQGLDYSEMNWCGFCLIPVPSGVEPPHNRGCPTL